MDHRAQATALSPFTARSAPYRAAPTATLPQAQHECVERVAGSTNLALPRQEARAPTLRDALDYRPALVIQGLSRATQQPRLSIRVASV